MPLARKNAKIKGKPQRRSRAPGMGRLPVVLPEEINLRLGTKWRLHSSAALSCHQQTGNHQDRMTSARSERTVLQWCSVSSRSLSGET
jgi:hypothetical protein